MNTMKYNVSRSGYGRWTVENTNNDHAFLIEAWQYDEYRDILADDGEYAAEKYLEKYDNSVGYLVTMQVGEKTSKYVWDTEDVDCGGFIDCPSYDSLWNSRAEAENIMRELMNYASEKGYQNTTFGIEVVDMEEVEA